MEDWSRLVKAHLQTIHCIEAGEEEAEPYLWAAGIAIGGDQVHEDPEDPNFLVGEPAYRFSLGSHGNLVTPSPRVGRGGATQHLRDGQQADILPGAGWYISRLRPFKVLGGLMEVPGIFVLILALLEEDNVSDDGAEAGHQALNDLLENRINRFIRHLNWGDLLSEALRKSQDEGISIEEAAYELMGARIGELKNELLGPPGADCDEGEPSLVERTIEDAITGQQNVFENIWSGIDPDDVIGVNIITVSTSDLLDNGMRIPIDERFGPSPCDDHGIFEIHGEIALSGRMIPVGVLPDAPRLRVEAVARRYSRRLRVRYITHIGGTHDGVPWIIGRHRAALMVGQGTRQFYVLAPDGSETPVDAARHEVTRSLYLRTRPNWTTEDNLLSLPQLSFFVEN